MPGEDYAAAIERGIDVTAYSLAELAEIETAARRLGTTARVQLKVDTGLSRGGAALGDWPTLTGAARQAEEAGHVRISGVWSHLACSDQPDHPANDQQEAAFREALAVADDAGLRPEVRHLANSAAAILRPSSRFDLVRCGIASFGLDPAPGQPGTADLGLVPAMTVRARLAMVKRIAAGASVSYGHTWTAEVDTTVALVPVGYAEGVPRAAGNRADVGIAGKRRPIRGVVCMDQFVVDLGDDAAEAGDEVVLFGSGAGGPTATEWAQAVGTINYEIVTRVGGRFTRRTIDSEETPT